MGAPHPAALAGLHLHAGVRGPGLAARPVLVISLLATIWRPYHIATPAGRCCSHISTGHYLPALPYCDARRPMPVTSLLATT